jgi:hypothetical protein
VTDGRFVELSSSAQAAYAEVAERTRSLEMNDALAGLAGSFHTLKRKGQRYWYFSYRDPGAARSRVLYVGPDNEAVRALVDRFQSDHNPRALTPQALAAIQLGCAAAIPKHFRVIKRLAEYGLFRGGAVLVGAHAFLALGNVLGVRWDDPVATLDIDIAHAGKNVSVALPASLHVNVRGARESLESGLLPMMELDGTIGTRYRSPGKEGLRVDFLTTRTRNGHAVTIPELNVALEPLPFMDFLLEEPTQGCLLGRSGACTVNLPTPERFAVHKLVVQGERPRSERTKSKKDLAQAAALASYHLAAGEVRRFNRAWRDLIGRGSGWARRGRAGRAALIRLAPELDVPALWKV